MGVFSRVKAEHAKDLSDLAKMRGIEHHIFPLAGDCSRWATFQFTNENVKRSFDRMVREEGYELQSDKVASSMLDAIMKGASPKSVLDEMVEQITPGMRRAYQKNGSGRSCPGCGLTIPKYSGSYPKKCPECGEVITNGE